MELFSNDTIYRLFEYDKFQSIDDILELKQEQIYEYVFWRVIKYEDNFANLINFFNINLQEFEKFICLKYIYVNNKLDRTLTSKYKFAVNNDILSKYVYELNDELYSPLDMPSNVHEFMEISKYRFYNESDSDLIFLYCLINSLDVYNLTNEEWNSFSRYDINLRKNDFISAFNMFFEDVVAINTQEKLIVSTFLKEQLKIILTPKTETSDFTITNVFKKFNMKRKNGPIIKQNDAIDIFVNCTPSSGVPFIQYNSVDDTQKIYLYEGNPVYEEIKIPNVVQYASKFIQNNCIYITVNCTLDSQHNTLKDNYTFAELDFNTNLLNISVPEDYITQRRIISYIEECFKIELFEEQDVKIKGYFSIQDIDIKEMVFHYLTVQNSLFSSYFYFEESTKTVSEKKRFNIHFNVSKQLSQSDKISKGGSLVSISFRDQDREVGYIIDAESKNQNFKTQNSLNLIFKARDIDSINFFRYVFLRILTIYKEEEPRIVNIYQELFGIKASKKSDLRKNNDFDKIEDLRSVAPNIFGKKYSTVCQCERQPIIISNDEIKEWEDLTFTNKYNQVENRKILTFADEEKRNWNFVCPTDDYPYPSYRSHDQSVSLGGNKYEVMRYPKVPCCNLSYKQEDVETDVISEKYEISQGPMTKIDMKKSGQKVLSFGRIVPMYSTFQYIFETLQVNQTIVRIGIPDSLSTLVHCCLLALDPNYVNLENKEEYVTKIRNSIAETINMNVFKQELYDFPDELIKRNIKDNNHLLDPYIYYRGVEEYFNINIFIFNPNGYINPLKDINVNTLNNRFSETVLEIPRCKITHIRRQTRRKCIFIMKNAKTIGLSRIHCELIGSIDKNIDEENYSLDKVNYVFNEDISDFFYFFVINTLRTYSWQKDLSINNLVGLINPFSNIEWGTYGEITGQRIDLYGKARILELNNNIYLSVPPTQPYNVKNIDTIKSCEKEIVIDLFGAPDFIAKEGYWYSYNGNKFALFVLCKHTDEISYDGKVAPIFEETNENKEATDFSLIISKRRDVERQASVLVQLINWLWKMHSKNKTGLEYTRCEFSEFWDAYVRETDTKPEFKVVKYSYYLDLNNEDVEKCINWCGTWFPQFFRDSKIWLYTELYNKLKLFFKRENEVLRGVYEIGIEENIMGLYTWDMDFKRFPFTKFFMTKEQYDIWQSHLLNVSSENSLIPIISSINHKYSVGKNAIILRTLIRDHGTKVYSKFFLLQNVKNGVKKSALYVSYMWHKENRNIGFTEYEFFENCNIVYFEISKNNEPIVTEIDNSYSNAFTAYILQFTSNKFAALLPL